MLIAIAGSDGAGKTTLCRKLQSALSEKNVPAVRMDRFDILDHDLCPSAAFVRDGRDSLREHALHMPDPARLLFILWSMAMTVSSPKLRESDPQPVIIYDSYWMKHVAVETIYGVPEQASISIVDMMPKPDLTIYLKSTPENLFDRKHDDLVPYECGMDPTCSRQSFVGHQRKIMDYLDRWSLQQNWLELDAMQTHEILVVDLIATIEAMLGTNTQDAP